MRARPFRVSHQPHTHTNTPTRHEGWCIVYVPGATWRENSRKLATTTAGDHCQAKGTGAICLLGGRSCFIWTHALTYGRPPWPAPGPNLPFPRAFPCVISSSSWHSEVYVQGTCPGPVCRKTGSSFSTVATGSPYLLLAAFRCRFSRVAGPINTSVACHALHSTKLVHLSHLGES